MMKVVIGIGIVAGLGFIYFAIAEIDYRNKYRRR